MGALLDKVEELARMSPDDGYVNEKDLVQNMRRMTALAQQIVYEFKQVEPSMEIVYKLRDDFEDLADRTQSTRRTRMPSRLSTICWSRPTSSGITSMNC